MGARCFASDGKYTWGTGKHQTFSRSLPSFGWSSLTFLPEGEIERKRRRDWLELGAARFTSSVQ